MDLNKDYSRGDLEAALEDPQPNPLSIAIGTFVAAYGRALLAQCPPGQPMPNTILLPEPTTAIERFAFDLIAAPIRKVGRQVGTTNEKSQ